MEPNEGKLSSGTTDTSNDTTSQPIGSHDVTLHQVSGLLENPKNLIESISSEYHLTARITNSSLSPRQLSLLLEVLNFQIVYFGCNFSMMLALSELLLRLTQGRQPHEISDNKIRLTVTVSTIILKELGGKSYSLYSGEYVLISSQLRELLVPYLISKRTYGSRYRTWRPEKFIRVSAVPVSTLYERNSKGTERYSSYTKGHGESHGNAHRQKTKPSMELDGDQTVPDKEERNLILRMTDKIHQISNQLWIKYKNLVE